MARHRPVNGLDGRGAKRQEGESNEMDETIDI